MDETKKTVEKLVATQTEKRAELLEIGRKIASSATPTIVAFVDLSSFSALTSEQEMPRGRWSTGSVISS
jgi:hypothetical protein